MLHFASLTTAEFKDGPVYGIPSGTCVCVVCVRGGWGGGAQAHFSQGEGLQNEGADPPPSPCFPTTVNTRRCVAHLLHALPRGRHQHHWSANMLLSIRLQGIVSYSSFDFLVSNFTLAL